MKLDIPAGLVRVGTVFGSAGRWYDASLKRWNQSSMQPIGGWSERLTTVVEGVPRQMIVWKANDGTRWGVISTHTKLYAFTQSATAPSDITPSAMVSGRADATASGGYGTGRYGAGKYGTPRMDSVSIQDATVWTLDTFGQDLYGVSPDDGRIIKWQRNTSVAAAALGGASPTGNAAIVVTPERFLMVLGAGSTARKVQWADQESDSTWTAAADNQAGDFELQSHGRLMCGKRLRASTVLFTDLDVHIAEYIQQPYIYRFTRVGENCGVISRGGAVASDSLAFWMSLNGFYVYDGAVRPIPCDVYDAVFSDINITQRSKVTCQLISQDNEVWWFYPSAGSTENDRAVVYNYAEGWWTFHYFGRTCGVDRGVFNYPMMCDRPGTLWDHETGFSYVTDRDDLLTEDGDLLLQESGDEIALESGTTSIAPYAESGPYEIGEGDKIARVRGIVFDQGTAGDIDVTFKVRDWPNDTETSHGPYTQDNPTSVRFAARAPRLRIDVTTAAAGTRWGAPRVAVKEGSRR